MYKVLIIGFGSIANKYGKNLNLNVSHYNAIKNSRNFKLVAIVDNKKVICKDYPCYKDYNIAIKKHKPDIIVLSTPTKSHFSILKKIIKFKNIKIVLCEKPFTENYLQAQKIKKLFKNSKTKIFINYMRNTDYMFSNMLHKYFKGKQVNGFVFYNGTTLNFASHYISLLVKYFGKVTNIRIIDGVKNNNFILKFKKAKFTFFSNLEFNNFYERLEIFNMDYFFLYNNGGAAMEIRKLIQNKIYGKKIFYKTIFSKNNKFYSNSQEYVFKELYKELKHKKKCSLPSLDIGIEVHKTLNLINNG